MKKIIIIGATGNTGIYLTEDLVQKLSEYEIVAVGRRETSFFNRYGIEYISMDISDATQFSRLPRVGVHAIIMLAGLLPAYMDGYYPEKYIQVNGLGALNVLRYCIEVGADRILYAQTISDVLGSVTPTSSLIHPNAPRSLIMTGDHTIYALSKCLAVDLIQHYSAQYGLKGFIFRLPTIYAYTSDDTWCVNGERRKLAYRIIMDRAREGKALEIWGNPMAAKDIVYVKDFCQLLRKAVVAQVDGGIYNVGTGVATTTEDQVRGIAAVFAPEGKNCEIIYRPDLPSGPSYLMDIENARVELGYNPQYGYIDYLLDFKKEMEMNRFSELQMRIN